MLIKHASEWQDDSALIGYSLVVFRSPDPEKRLTRVQVLTFGTLVNFQASEFEVYNSLGALSSAGQ